jgi:hypothetical protein
LPARVSLATQGMRGIKVGQKENTHRIEELSG